MLQINLFHFLEIKVKKKLNVSVGKKSSRREHRKKKVVRFAESHDEIGHFLTYHHEFMLMTIL